MLASNAGASRNKLTVYVALPLKDRLKKYLSYKTKNTNIVTINNIRICINGLTDVKHMKSKGIHTANINDEMSMKYLIYNGILYITQSW